MKPEQVLNDLGQSWESWINTVYDEGQSFAVGLSVPAQQLSQALKDLPATARELAEHMPQVSRRISRAGLRSGDSTRGAPDIMELFGKIPGTSKLRIQETDIQDFLNSRDASHIISVKNGGGNQPSNLVWELSGWNRIRGPANMTFGGLLTVRIHNALSSIIANSDTIARVGLTSLGIAVLTQTVVTALAYTLDLQRGAITVEEYKDKVLTSAKTAGIATVIVFPLLIAVLALLPELTFLLATPVVVMGLNAAFGVSLTIPILQSLVRHIEAEGFGTDVSSAYKQIFGVGDRMNEPET